MIKLRSIRESDSEKLFAWINDEELVRFSYYFRPVSEMEHKKWFYSIFDRTDQVLFGVEDSEKTLLIGTCGLFGLDYISRRAEMRIKLGDKAYWGSGAGTEAVVQLVEFGFKDLNLNRIWLKVMGDNDRALKSYQKAGFKVEGKLRQDMFIDSQYKDVVIMGRLAGESQ